MKVTCPRGKKRVAYDDLTLLQLIVGQLSNIFYMKDQTTAKHALLQVILAIKEATSLPWTAVRGAWATSMHDLEEGHLGWQDTTQWSLNPLRASQIYMATSHQHQPPQHRKVCTFLMKAPVLMSSAMVNTNTFVPSVIDKER